jgi:hypothetical protein
VTPNPSLERTANGMDPSQRQRLVHDYVAARTLEWGSDMVLRKKEPSNRAEEALYEAVWKQPDVAWDIMCEISRATSVGDILQSIANGPLHQMLLEHPRIIDRIEKDAEASPQVRLLLSHIWDDSSDSQIRSLMPRIRAASGEFDEPPAA